MYTDGGRIRIWVEEINIWSYNFTYYSGKKNPIIKSANNIYRDAQIQIIFSLKTNFKMIKYLFIHFKTYNMHPRVLLSTFQNLHFLPKCHVSNKTPSRCHVTRHISIRVHPDCHFSMTSLPRQQVLAWHQPRQQTCHINTRPAATSAVGPPENKKWSSVQLAIMECSWPNWECTQWFLDFYAIWFVLK